MPSLTRRARSTPRVAASLLGATLALACHGDRIAPPGGPDHIEIVTADILNFWRAYDAGGRDGSAAAFQSEYLNKASAGLRDFVARRNVTATSLAQMVLAYPRYFAAVRAPMTSLATDSVTTRPVRVALEKLRDLYPPARFPAVTLLVGRFATAGTTGGSGILVGAEFYADAATPRDELGAFQQTYVHGVDSLAFVVTHESVHVQQMYAGTLRGSSATLLEQAFMEGSADFVGELASGGNIDAPINAWALPREAQLWAEFKLAMDGTDVSRWLYNQGTATTDRPGDLGYFVGYRIAQAYYDAQADKRAAVRDIITAADVKAFLAKSGYDPR